MVVELTLDDVFGSLNFGQELLARLDGLLAQITGTIKDLIDVEVHLE